MASQRFNSRALRQLAERFLRKMVQDGAVAAADHAELATALVRQWMTYEGRATLFVGNQRLDVFVDMARPRQCSVSAETGPNGWINQVCSDWKISPEQLPDLIRQLNRGQSAEIVNADGMPVRLWVNPREHSMGVEDLAKQPAPPRATRDFHKIAAHQVEQYLGVAPHLCEGLVASIAQQWQQYEGHASLFLSADLQLILTLKDQAGGGCVVTSERVPVSLGPLLGSLGIPPLEIPMVITQINCGVLVQVRNPEGIPSVLSHDPKLRQFVVRSLPAAPPS